MTKELAPTRSVILGTLAFLVLWITATFPKFPFLPVGRTSGALVASVLMVVFQVLTPDEAYQSINLPILGLLFGTMVVSIYLEKADMFKHLGRILSWRCRGGKDLLCRLSFLVAATSAIFTNDTCCVLFTGFILSLCKDKGLNPEPFLLALATSANIGSSATPIGNPQNLVIAIQGKIPFGKFVRSMFPAMIVGVAVNTGLLLAMYWKHLNLPAPPCKMELGNVEIIDLRDHTNNNDNRMHSHINDDDDDANNVELGSMALRDELLHIDPINDANNVELGSMALREDLPHIGQINDANNVELGSMALREDLPHIDQINDAKKQQHVATNSVTSCNNQVSAVFNHHVIIEPKPENTTISCNIVTVSSSSQGLYASPNLAHLNEVGRIRTYWSRFFQKPCVYFVTIGMLVAFLCGLDLSWCAITAAIVLVALDFQDGAPCLNKVSYSLLVFFSGMFVTVEGFNKTGLPSVFWNVVEPHARINNPSGVAVLAAVVMLLSNIASNVPTVLLLGPKVASSSSSDNNSSRAWLYMAWSSTIAGNLSLVGSAANLIVCEQARCISTDGPKLHFNLSFWMHLKYGFFSTLLIAAIGLPLIQA